MATLRTGNLLTGGVFTGAADLTAWTEVAGTWEVVNNDDGTVAVDSVAFAKPTDASADPAELSQVVDISGYADSTDRGLVRCALAGLHAGRSSDNDKQQFVVEALDASDVFVSTVADSGVLDTNTNAWASYASGFLLLPSTTRKIRVRLIADRQTTTAGFDSYFDNVQLFVEVRPLASRDLPLFSGLTYFNKYQSVAATEPELALGLREGAFSGTAGRVAGGQYGKAYQSGAASDFLSTPDYPEARTDPTSVAAWVYMDALPSAMFGSAPRIILAKGDGVNSGYFLGCTDGTDDIRFRVIDQALSVYEAVYTAVPADVGTWIHLVGTQDGSEINIYKDGVLIDTGLVSGDVQQDPAEPLVVGLNWEGRIDEVAAWNRKLSTATLEGADEISDAAVEMSFPDLENLNFPVYQHSDVFLQFPFSLNNFLNNGAGGLIDSDSFALFAADGSAAVSPRAAAFVPLFRGTERETVTLLDTGARVLLPFRSTWDPRSGGWDIGADKLTITAADAGRSLRFQGRYSPTNPLGGSHDMRVVLVRNGTDYSELAHVASSGTPEVYLDVSLEGVEGDEFWLEAYLASGSDLEITPIEFLVHRVLDEWTATSLGADAVRGVAAHLTRQRWFAADSGGHVWSSFDGLAWTDLGAVHSSDLFAVAIDQDNDRVVVAGADGAIWTSDDLGTSWVNRVSQFGTDTIRGLCWDRQGFTAVGDGGKISTSPTGTTWTARASGIGTSLRAVATSDEGGSPRRVAVGASGVALYSDDEGATWQATAAPGVGADTLLGIGHDDSTGRWVACGTNNRLIFSDDPASSWGPATIPDGFLGLDWVSVSHGCQGAWILVSSSGETMSSFFGDRWVGVTSGLEGSVGTVAVSQPRFLPAASNEPFFAVLVFAPTDFGNLQFPLLPELPYTDSPFQFLLTPRDPDPTITTSEIDCLLGILDAAALFGPSDALSVTRYWEVEIVPDDAYLRIGEQGDLPISDANDTSLTLNFVFPDGINLGGKRLRYVIYPNTFCGAVRWESPWVLLPDCDDGDGSGGGPTPGHGNVVLADLLVINIYDPELTSPYEISREPDIDTSTAVTFYWTGLQLAEDDPPPALVDYEQRSLVIKNLQPGRFRFRFTAHFATEILQQDFVLFVRPETDEGVV